MRYSCSNHPNMHKMAGNKKLKILVAEGNPAEKASLARALSSLGHDVETVAEGRGAVSKLQNGRFDISFIDKNLPEAGGLEVLEKIIALCLETAPIVTAAHLSASDSIQAAHRGACDYIVKPLTTWELELIIRRCLDRQRSDHLRKRFLDDIIRTGRFYQDILENVRSGIWVTDRHDKVIYFNRAIEKMFSVQRDSVLGKNFFERFSTTLEKMPELASHYKKAKNSLETALYDNLRIIHGDGRESIQSGGMFPLKSERGDFDGMVVTVEDITEHKKAEEDLKESERRFQDIVANTGDWIWEVDKEGLYTYSSPAVEQVLGYTAAEVIDKHFSVFFQPEYREMLKAKAHEAFNKKEPFRNFINLNIHKDGRIIILETSGVPIIADDGELIGYRGADRDVTVRKRAEEELALSRQWYQTIFDTANDAIFIHDAAGGKILDVNEKMCEMYGYTKAEAREMNIGRLSNGEYPYSQEEALKWVKRAFTGGPQIFEWMARHKDGHLFPVEVNLKRALIGGEERILAIIRDITTRKKLEKELIHAEKMAGVGQLAAGIAHEFNNFLAMISGYAQLAKAGTLADKERAIDVAEKVSERAKTVVKNLISFAREDKPEKKPADIAEILEEALAPLSTQLKRQGITIKRHYSPVPMTLCDPGQIRQVLFNIILNAIQAMREGGDLAIYLFSKDDEVVIKIVDAGCGIPDEIQEKIFDPFITTKGAIAGGEISGTGLGLSVSYGLIKEHGGDIGAENNVGGGATFTISLPTLTEAPSAETRAASRAGKPGVNHAQTRAKIMVIDDEAVILDLLTDILKNHGKRITAIQDPRLALSILKRESYDIIFLDLVMPGYPGGLGLFREIKKIARRARIILLTGKEMDEEIKAALGEGACDFISKPFPVEEIKGIVEAALKKGRP